jgi:hypothetical protein
LKKGHGELKLATLVLLTLLAPQAHAQLQESIRQTGDLTLFGDPDCAYWLLVEPRAKQVWLQAILSPINMGYMQREKPSSDKFAELKSLVPAMHYVDHYCASRQQGKAMVGAMRFFEELTLTAIPARK